MQFRLLLLVVFAVSSLRGLRLGAQDDFNPIPPTKGELARMLEAAPLSEATWPTWRQRYLDCQDIWNQDSRPFSDVLADFVHGQYADGELPPYLTNDALAWHLCARATREKEENFAAQLAAAEVMSRRAIALDPRFRAGHEGLASTLTHRAMEEPARRDEFLAAAEASIAEAGRIDPNARVAYLQSYVELARENYVEAERLSRQAMAEHPDSDAVAVTVAQAILAQPTYAPSWSEAIQPLRDQFADNADLMAMHALALAREQKFADAAVELRQAQERDPKIERYIGPEMVTQFETMAQMMTPELEEGLKALEEQRFTDAVRLLRAALDEQPGNVIIARSLAHALMSQPEPGLQRVITSDVVNLAQRFPQDGELQTLAGVSLANAERFAQAKEAFDRARALNFDLTTVIDQQDLDRVEDLAKPGFLTLAMYGVAAFIAVYACIMLAMVAGGWILSRFNREVPQVSLEVAGSRVAASGRETWSARLYTFVLVFGLIMFYVAIPFLVIGAIGMTLGLLYGTLMLPRIPLQLLLFIVLAGGAICWGVLKAVFARPSDGAFGIRKTAADLPRLHAAVQEVARKVGTDPTDEIYIAPGSEIGVHQQGRGPFGAFGVKRRVMTLGLSSLELLTVNELKAILAHEYAHFSHADTAHSRFIHQVSLSIDVALNHMGSELGRWNYVNPFFWFFYGYYKAYNMLAAGYSRTREYLADRMAVAHYGKTAFINGLTKVATDGRLFEATAHSNIRHLLSEGKAFENVYDAFRQFRDNDFPAEEREKMERELTEQKPSQFATHPTYLQRAAAIAGYPDFEPDKSESAISLVDDVDGLEKSLTEYLTSYHSMIFQLVSGQHA